MNTRTANEIPRLSLDKIVSIFQREDSDAYQPGLLIGRRSSSSTSIKQSSFVHPFSINAFVLIFCEEGEVTISANLQDVTLKKNDLYINFPGQIMRATKATDCSTLIATFDLDFILQKNLDLKPIAQKLLALRFSQLLSMDSRAFREIENVTESIADEIRNNEPDASSGDIVRSLITTLFFQIGRAVDRNINQAKNFDQEAFSKNAGYFKEFMVILGQNFKKERSVGFYADQMHLSPKYFTTLIKRTSGQTAAEWINRSVILEAKNLLRYSTMNIQEIAYSLNFPNQSFFGKYFKHHTGMTPSEYKKL